RRQHLVDLICRGFRADIKDTIPGKGIDAGINTICKALILPDFHHESTAEIPAQHSIEHKHSGKVGMALREEPTAHPDGSLMLLRPLNIYPSCPADDHGLRGLMTIVG